MRMRVGFLCYLSAVLLVEFFVQVTFSEMEIDFLRSCKNSQIHPLKCSDIEHANIKDYNQKWNMKNPTFIIGSIWDNHYVLYGNFVIPISQESCKFYNTELFKNDHFAVWKIDTPGQLAFEYTDTTLNMFAMESEVLITEICMGGYDGVFNKTIKHGSSRIDLDGVFGIKCPFSELLELVIETCSYCYKDHEAGECFDKTIDLRSSTLETRYPCDRCHIYAVCQEKYCVCRQGFAGDGSKCWPVDNGENIYEIIVGAMSGVIGVLVVIAVAVRYFRRMKSKKVHNRGTIESQIQNNEKVEFIIDKDNTSPSKQVTKIPWSPNCVLVLYHPDNLAHQRCVINLFQQLKEHKIRVRGLPEDYLGNWMKLAEDVDRLFSDVVIVTSPDLCELLRLFNKQGNRNVEEEMKWKLLLEARCYEYVPCRVLDRVGRLFKDGVKHVPDIHIVSFQDNEDSLKLKTISTSQCLKVVSAYTAYRHLRPFSTGTSIWQGHNFTGKDCDINLHVKCCQIRISRLQCNKFDIDSMASTFKAFQENK